MEDHGSWRWREAEGWQVAIPAWEVGGADAEAWGSRFSNRTDGGAIFWEGFTGEAHLAGMAEMLNSILAVTK